MAIFFYDLFFGKSTEFELEDDAVTAHRKRVEHVVKQVADAKFPLFTARPNWQRVSSRVNAKRPGTAIDMSALNKMVAFDPEHNSITVEPGVRMVELSHFLERTNQILPSVPELDDLTVSGLLMGCGIESTGFKYGMFNECVIAYEVLMADRKVHRITKDSDPDVFYSLPWSYGTLGLLLSVEMRTVPSKPYVRLNIQHIHDRKELCEVLAKASNRSDLDFVEALAFSPTHTVVTTGTWATSVNKGEEYIELTGRTSKWFYEEAKNCTSDVVVMKMTDYIHRHSKGIFWELSYLQPFANTWWFRTMLGWLTPPKIATVKRFQPRFTLEWFSENHVVQDYLLPIDKLHECLDLGDEELGVYPIWLCPYVNKKHAVDTLMHPHSQKDEMYIDVGYYGLPSPKNKPVWLNCNMTDLCVNFESWLMKNKGFVMLYAYHGLDQESIRKMFCHKTYDKVRAKYDKEDVKMYPSILAKVGKVKSVFSKPEEALKSGKKD